MEKHERRIDRHNAIGEPLLEFCAVRGLADVFAQALVDRALEGLRKMKSATGRASTLRRAETTDC